MDINGIYTPKTDMNGQGALKPSSLPNEKEIATSVFNSLDGVKDKDNQISKEEWVHAHSQPPHPHSMRSSSPKDQKKVAEHTFKEADKDKSGTLNKKEFMAHFEKTIAELKAKN